MVWDQQPVRSLFGLVSYGCDVCAQAVRSEAARHFPVSGQSQSSAGQMPSPQVAVEVRLTVRGGIAFRMEHHPLEVRHM